MKLSTVCASLGIVGALGITGCGGHNNDASTANADTSSAQITRVVDDLGQAARAGDGKRICDDIFSKALRDNVQRASRSTCAEAVRAKIASPHTAYTVRSVRATNTAARVVVVDDARRSASLLLTRDSDSWRIASVGA